jgi:SAM-dependent methyltransferase
MVTQPTTPGTDDWDRHWKEQAALNALNPAQVYRRELIFDALALKEARYPVRVLDLGCGSGEMMLHATRLRPDAEILGFDLSQQGVDFAKRKVPQGTFRQRDFTAPGDAGDPFLGWATHATCSEVLEHIDDPARALRNVKPYLAPGAKLVITVPAGPMSMFDKHIGHRRHFTPAGLRKVIEDAGLIAEDVRGAGFPFFNLYRLAVVARGQKLVDDTAGQSDGSSLPLTARAMIRTFGLLFKMNTSKTELGWQLVAVARAPG